MTGYFNVPATKTRTDSIGAGNEKEEELKNVAISKLPRLSRGRNLEMTARGSQLLQLNQSLEQQSSGRIGTVQRELPSHLHLRTEIGG